MSYVLSPRMIAFLESHPVYSNDNKYFD